MKRQFLVLFKYLEPMHEWNGLVHIAKAIQESGVDVKQIAPNCFIVETEQSNEPINNLIKSITNTGIAFRTEWFIFPIHAPVVCQCDREIEKLVDSLALAPYNMPRTRS